ncbi:hypothetical protein [Cellulomonas sp. IC4_254]|uniref:hypothetical protein n=1 Tax=Cellulomonas sp. IC4_254 TaxID=2714040 RepID=UPI00141F0D0D|nr:hypothetical protein [Cellulomonas sp. IC4_254]NHT17170.1 hypothetical protein [Cellulomonas sp. IC4_254]
MSTDDEFARELRSRVDASAPTIDVRLTGVVPRARRRRAWTRAAGAGAAGGLVLAGVLVGQAWAGAPWSTHTLAGPAATGEPVETGEPSPEPSAAADAARRAGTAQGAAPYWYTLITGPDGSGERFESWASPDRPGLLVWDGDLTNPAAMGPTNVIGRFRIGGEWVDMLRDPAALPTDPAALEQVFRDSVEPDRRSGTDDDKVYGMAYDLLNGSPGWLPTALLQAAWQVAGSLPGSTVVPGVDSLGRPGEVLTRPETVNGSDRLVVDPATGLILEMNSGDAIRLLQQSPADTIPLEPTLEMAGCTAWESC